MNPPQPPGAPREQWHERKDTSTRVVIDRLDGLDKELEELLRKAGSWVTIWWLVGILGGAACIIVGASWSIAKDTRTEMLANQARMADDVRQLRSEMAGKVTASDAQVSALYKVLVEGRSKAQARAEAEGAVGK